MCFARTLLLWVHTYAWVYMRYVGSQCKRSNQAGSHTLHMTSRAGVDKPAGAGNCGGSSTAGRNAVWQAHTYKRHCRSCKLCYKITRTARGFKLQGRVKMEDRFRGERSTRGLSTQVQHAAAAAQHQLRSATLDGWRVASTAAAISGASLRGQRHQRQRVSVQPEQLLVIRCC